MNVLIACEESATVRDAFRAAGHDAWSCDILPTRGDPQYHILGDAVATAWRDAWDLMIAFPPCQYLASSGLHWNKRDPARQASTEVALAFVRALLDAPVPRIALENSIGCISTRIRKPDQIVQPYQFGHDASKATCLWLKGLPLLVPSRRVPGRMVNGRERWANQTDSGQNRLAPSDTRARDRAVTYPGIAAAMVAQWGDA
jgi:hypothetical protein